MNQSNWANVSSTLIGSLIMDINRLQLIPPAIEGIIDNKIDVLKDAEDIFQEAYAIATTAEDYKRLLETQKQSAASTTWSSRRLATA